MDKRIYAFIIAIFVCILGTTPAFAASADIYNFNLTPDDVTFMQEGYEHFTIHYYSSYWYLCYFNEEDLVEITGDSSSGYIMKFSEAVPYYRSAAGDASVFVLARYGGVSDCSDFIASGYPRTATEVGIKATTAFVMTNSDAVSEYFDAEGISTPDSYKMFFNGLDDKEYTVYSIIVDSSGAYIVSLSSAYLKIDTTTSTLSSTSGNLYNFRFATKDNALDFIQTGVTDGLISCDVSTSVKNVSEVFYSSTYIKDQSGEVYFERYEIPAPETSGGEGSGDKDYTGWFGNIIEAVNNLGTNLANFFNGLADKIGGFFTDLKNFFTELFSYPAEFVQEKIDEFLAKFSFVENIKIFGDELIELFTKDHSQAPKIEVSLSNSEGKYNYGTSAIALDLSWYGKTWQKSGICLKSIGDIVISSFLWLGFLWNLFKNLPNLISGGSIITDMSTTTRRETSMEEFKKGGGK